MFKVALFILSLFLVNHSFSQNSIGKVKIEGKPADAIIKLEDSILRSGEIYLWPQGVFKLQISTEGYQTYNNSYFQVFKDKVNVFKYNLKKQKEPKFLKTYELLSPIVIIPLTYVFANTLFPTSSLNEAKSLVEYQKAFVLLAQSNLENDSWQNDISTNQAQFESSMENYNRAVEEHNDLVRKNNRNSVIRPIIIGTAAVANLYYLYSVYKKRKRTQNEIGLNISPNHLSLSIDF